MVDAVGFDVVGADVPAASWTDTMMETTTMTGMRMVRPKARRMAGGAV